VFFYNYLIRSALYFIMLTMFNNSVTDWNDMILYNIFKAHLNYHWNLGKFCHSTQFTCGVLSAESDKTIVQTVTSCFIRKVKLYLNVFKSFHSHFHNKTKFKKRWIKSMRYCVLNFSYFEHISFIFISNK
jgi:hypothetical protein